MKRTIAFVVATTISSAAYGGIETDRTVGNCAGLLSVLKKQGKMIEAFGYADNQNRAIKFAKAWIEKADGYAARGNQTLVNGMVYSATSECREIGIRASD